MRKKKLIRIAFLVCSLSVFYTVSAQEINTENTVEVYSSRFGNEVRGKNAVTIGVGTTIINGDFKDPKPEITFHAGYKRFLGSYANINFTYHKFNLAYKDLLNEGYMSFDLNLELYLSPYRTFTPFIYAGGGFLAANYFEQTEMKVQGGVGLEYLFTESIGIKIYGDYNHVFSDSIDGLEFGNADDAYWQIGLGLNLYFGKRLVNTKISKIPTVINSNQLVDDY